MRRHVVFRLSLTACVAMALSACGSVPEVDPGMTLHALTVTVAGGGSVTSAPAGIDCGAQCSAEIAAGTAVTLTATPDAGAAFVGWGGDCAGDTCTVTMDAAKTVTATFAPHGSKRWIAHISFSGQDIMEDIVVDPQGDLIAAGTVNDGAGSDLYIAKYAKADGKQIWTQRFITVNGGEDLGGLATDASGNVYIAARLQGTGAVMFGTRSATGDLFGNIVVMRLAANTGAIEWLKQWGGTGQDIPEALAVTGGDLYVAGNTSSNPSAFDGISLAGATGNGFIVRASTANGAASVAKLVPGSVDLLGLATNGAMLGVAGQTRTAFTLDSCAPTPSGVGSDAMILGLSRITLGCLWSKTFGDSVANQNATTHAIAAYPGGGWVIAGSFQGSILLADSGSSLTSRGGFDVFTGRFTESGQHIWSFRYGDTGFDVGYGVDVTPEGAVLLAGAFDTSITFGAATVTGVRNTFVTRMSPGNAPTHEWAVGLGGADYDLAEEVAVAPDGSVYVLSSFTGMTNLSGTPLTSRDYDAWIGALVR